MSILVLFRNGSNARFLFLFIMVIPKDNSPFTFSLLSEIVLNEHRNVLTILLYPNVGDVSDIFLLLCKCQITLPCCYSFVALEMSHNTDMWLTCTTKSGKLIDNHGEL